jgi:hypothetical protein
MARGRGRGTPLRGRGKFRDYYEGIPTDVEYKRVAHQRAVQRSRKRWLIRLLIVALIAGAVYLWGDDVMRMASSEARQTGAEVKQVGGNIREGVERRSGADWVEGEPQ